MKSDVVLRQLKLSILTSLESKTFSIRVTAGAVLTASISFNIGML